MITNNKYQGGENFSLRDILLKGRRMNFNERTAFFSDFINELNNNNQNLYMRVMTSAADREVSVYDPLTNEIKKMLMFGSNNYLGLANHPYVKQATASAIEEYGVGIGGPPLLNGYTKLHYEVEEMLARFKGKESAMIFSSGYGANVGLITGLVNPDDVVLYDEYSHASFCDGLKMGKINSEKFSHNKVTELEGLLKKYEQNCKGDMFVGVEGVYSMDGDLAPLKDISFLCSKYNAHLIIDDAHGTGVIGRNGKGTADYFGVDDKVDVMMGTFSKAFGVTGGFVCASKEIINYLRFFGRSYMFSASLPPVTVAAVKAGLEVMQNEPELFSSLQNNISYAVDKINEIGFDIKTSTPIIVLRVPSEMNIREAVCHFHKLGIFLNSVEYPAVPLSQQRFRISIMATHTKEDIDRLAESIREVWNKFSSNSQINLAA